MVVEDFVVGAVPLVPLELFESLELSGDFSVLEIVFLRRSSLKKGIVAVYVLYVVQRGVLSPIATKY